MNIMQSIKLGSVPFLAILISACAAPTAPTQSAKGPAMPDPGADGNYTVDFPQPGKRATDRFIRLTIGKDLAQECKLVATQFEFDSSEPLVAERLELKFLSQCLAEPSRKALTLRLVGRTDSQGSSKYNQELGMRRAERVKHILVSAGLSEDRIDIGSRGESGALSDNDERYSRGYDRRVDVQVIGMVHAP
jgi:outer membrane protein OmpA-like peptidoglycan-associated protein